MTTTTIEERRTTNDERKHRNQESLILATDLDGTFLGGSAEDQRRLYQTLRNMPGSVLIFVTGRGLESVLPLLGDPSIPDPDYIICDVGATVVHGETLEPVQPIQAEIERRWPGTLRVLEALARFPHLQRQKVPQERRCSFLVAEEEVGAELRRAVAELECDLLFSAGRYLDVLPRGVSKGSTLRALIAQEGLDPDDVVVAGDTLNDLSLFECGLKGIVVGEAEPALRERVAENGDEGTYIAVRPGGGGILEGLRVHGMLPDSVDDQIAEAEDPAGDAQLVMVYHRLPFEEIRRGGKVHRRPPRSPNGIIPTLLGSFADGREGSWVAWSKQPSREVEGFETHVAVDPERYPKLTAARIPLTEEDVNLFYEAFSKEAFWPVIFSFPSKVVFREEHWHRYVEINRLFAEQAAREAKDGALVWIHDYNLWLVPGFLRELRPDVRIAFFHHTAFPPPDIFNIIPWRREIIGSLLQCDHIGFHIPRYVENFVDVVRSHAAVEVRERTACAPRYRTYGCSLGVDSMASVIRVGERDVSLGAHPVGIDVELIHSILERDDVRERMREIRRDLDGRRCILSIERLDYVKGPLEKLQAFEKLLEEHPELHGEVTLLTVCTPPAPGMKIYRRIREKVDQAVGRINGRFAKLGWQPVHYFFRSLPFEEVVAHYAVADVAWITPLRDGLNMVAKEFVAANKAEKGDGVLVISEFAGAAVELHGAILTNPYHPESMAEHLHRAITLEPEERRARMKRLDDIVRNNDVSEWAREFMESGRRGDAGTG